MALVIGFERLAFCKSHNGKGVTRRSCAAPLCQKEPPLRGEEADVKALLYQLAESGRSQPKDLYSGALKAKINV